MIPLGLTAFQRFGLVLLRTLIGWHFLYEGYYKLMLPGWNRDGAPMPAWSAAGYLKAASGPFGGLFRSLAESGVTAWVDVLVPIALVLVGLSLVLGLFTQLGCLGALALLSLFYLAQIPTDGLPHPGSEGAYLIVSKTLLEWAAVLALLAFRTGRIAGLDVWLLALRQKKASAPVAADAGVTAAAPAGPR